MKSANARCTDALDASLVYLLFKNECPLCESRVDALVPVGCALGHSFCRPCLGRAAREHMSIQVR